MLISRALTALVVVGAVGCTSSSGSPAAPPSGTTTPSASAATVAPSPPSSLAPVRLAEFGAFTSPVWVGPVPGDPEHLYLVQKSGAILRLSPEGVRQGVVLDLAGQVSGGGERGLLSMAFDPAFVTNKRIYVNFTDLEGDTRVVAYTIVNGVAVRPELLITIGQPYPNHNGGLVLFDSTGMLLVGMGDGGNAGDPQNRAQDLDTLLGKILRIDPRTGQAAPGNPYPRSPYVWALGLRNPWRFSFDTNGDLYLGDVGQNRVEELNVLPPEQQRGANYGWSIYEGNERFKENLEFTPGGPVIAPALTYTHAEGGCSITGGTVYRGRAIPWLVGRYVYGDYCAPEVFAVTRTSKGLGAPLDLGVKTGGVLAFGTDTDGELLVLTVDAVYRLVPGA